jgi:hypothetical protein
VDNGLPDGLWMASGLGRRHVPRQLAAYDKAPLGLTSAADQLAADNMRFAESHVVRRQ